MASNNTIEEFLTGPLVTWMGTCVKKPDSLQVIETFFDGAPFAEVLLQIDPEPPQPIPCLANFSNTNITFARIKIFNTIIHNIKSIYEEELGQVVINLPDCVILGRSAGSEASVQQFKLLLLLLLGCAVQGPTKEQFILKIKQLPLEIQHEIVCCIKQVTDDQNIVLTMDHPEHTSGRLYQHIRSLMLDRDKLLGHWISDLGQVSQPVKEVVQSNHLAVELADWKAKLRKLRQELEEKSEILAECREELDHTKSLVTKLKSENSDLMLEARRAKLYQDELDAMKERLERADRLEIETQRYRERLADAEFYKVRVDELREDNRVLLETREMLESQLARARQRAEHVLELESELLASKQSLNEILLERDSAKDKIQELLDENLQLQQMTKSVLQENSNILLTDNEEDEVNSGDNSLSEQLTNNAQTRALKLELENKKLLSLIESLKEKSFHENANKLLELEKDKKRLSLKCEQLQQSYDNFKQQNEEFESLFKNLMNENKKLEENLETQKAKQSAEIVAERSRITDLEKSIETVTKEKQRFQLLTETIKKRADSSEKSLNQLNEELQLLQKQVEESKLVSQQNEQHLEKIQSLEKENSALVKDVTKFKELIEAKDVALDKKMEENKFVNEELQKSLKDIQNLKTQIERLSEFEQKSQELSSQISIFQDSVVALQNDLIAEKLKNDRCRSNLEKLSLNFELLDGDVNVMLEQILKDPKFVSILKRDVSDSGEIKNKKIDSELVNLQGLNEVLQEENAKLKVDIATLKSQVQSLQSQQMALQLANSQLVAEKDELSKQQKIQSGHHDTLILDQTTLQTLHEQLTSEYEHLKLDQEALKRTNRDLRSEIRTIRETNSNQSEKISNLECEKESLKNDSKNLVVLRAEHSKLKDDFRNLFTASERLKIEYRNIQEELKNVRTESRSLRLGQTEMQGELNTTSDLVTGLHLENSKLQQKCDMLFEMNHSLDSDRRALMDHVSQLLTQYHSLLTHSLEDKQHYHHEEKLYTDKVNNLCRQKEKLEEKIMEHYRKLDNASCKKKSFGATLVRKVRKAGSDIINKVPRNRRSWHEDSTTSGQFPASGESDDENKTTNAESQPFEKPDNNLSLGSVGSRRTVYLSEEEPNTTTPQAPFLVYNRISTVLGAPNVVETQTEVKDEEKVRKDVQSSKETAVWYEYGCV